MRFLSGRLNAYAVYMLYSGLSAFAQNTIFTMNMVYQVETVKLNPLQLVLVGTTLETTCFLFGLPAPVAMLICRFMMRGWCRAAIRAYERPLYPCSGRWTP